METKNRAPADAGARFGLTLGRLAGWPAAGDRLAYQLTRHTICPIRPPGSNVVLMSV
jgi:hypothetical protein